MLNCYIYTINNIKQSKNLILNKCNYFKHYIYIRIYYNIISIKLFLYLL